MSLLLLAASPVLASTWSIDPTTNVLTLGEGDSFTETVTVTVPPEAVSTRADVYLLADTTGSMYSPIAAIRAGALAIVADLHAALPETDLCFGVGNYKDFPYDSYAFDHQNAVCDDDALILDGINSWASDGGADGSEAQLFALDRLAADLDPAGGSIGWRDDAEKIIVWFGDAPGHDAVCSAISGLAYDITEGTVTEDLVGAGITVLAISTTTGYPDGLDDDPTLSAYDYSSTCSVGGTAGQATRIADATGGVHMMDVASSAIVTVIQGLVEEAVTTLGSLSLVPAGEVAPYVTLVEPAAWTDIDVELGGDFPFDVEFTGTCVEDGPVTLHGSLDATADGVVQVQKTVELTLPSCNEPPVALCADVTVDADEDCLGCATVDAGSYDPDGDPILVESYPECDYELGSTSVTLSVTDSWGATASCEATVTVVDTTPPEVWCNGLAEIKPNMVPIRFTATADDNCGAEVAVTGYDCWAINGSGKRISKLWSCVVGFEDDVLTVYNSGGVGTVIDWTVEAWDEAGNLTEAACSTKVINPGKSGK